MNLDDHIYFAIRSPQLDIYGGSNYWILEADYTNTPKWNLFVRKILELAETLVPFICSFTIKGKHGEIIKLDNVGDHRPLKKVCGNSNT